MMSRRRAGRGGGFLCAQVGGSGLLFAVVLWSGLDTACESDRVR